MIKTVSPEDKNIINQIVQLETDAFGEGGLNQWDLVPLIRHGRVFYMEENGLAAGCVQYMLDWNDHTKAYAIGISIARNQRGKGYGTALFRESMDTLAAEGIQTVELTVDPENTAAIAVYGRKLGFVITGRRDDEYGTGIHRIVMEKGLASNHK